MTVPAHWQERAARAQQNRVDMPLVTAFVDALRQHFPQASVRYANENGIEVGKRGPTGVQASEAWTPPEKPQRQRREHVEEAGLL